MRVAAALLLVVGCGRSGFGPEIDASRADDAFVDPDALDPFDAPPGSMVVTFGETPNATFKGVTADTYVNSEIGFQNYNYGASARLSSEGSQKRALIRFDLSSLAPSTQVVGARVHLDVVYLETTTTISVAPILQAWTGGTQAGAAGVANYTQRTATQNWTTPGAGSPGSTGATIGMAQITALGEVGIDLPVATLQGWISNAGTNFGFAISASGGDFSISSADEPTSTSRPELVVTYYP